MSRPTSRRPVTIGPTGKTAPGFEFIAKVTRPWADDPITRARIEVRRARDDRPGVWVSSWLRVSDERKRRIRIADPGQPTLPAAYGLEWRIRTKSKSKLVGPWSDWQTFRITHAAPSIQVEPIDTVDTLVGLHMPAEVRIPNESGSIARYEIVIAPRRAKRQPALWDDPERTVRFDGDDFVQAPVEPSGKRPKIRFDTLHGHPAVDGVEVGSERPQVVIRTRKPAKSYRWKLWQHGDLIAEGEPTRSGVSEDSITFTLPRVARSGPGYFAPPFKPPSWFRKKGKRPRTYSGQTHKPGNEYNPAGHSAYAVDFNRGATSDDRGDPVLAAAEGHVREIHANKVLIEHYDGAYETEYGHIRQRKLKVGQRIAPLARVGWISDVGSTGVVHLHHRHAQLNDYAPLKGVYKPIKMRFGGEPVTVSRASRNVVVNASSSEPYAGWKSDYEGFEYDIAGWTSFDPEATLKVWVTWENGRESRRHSLRFSISGVSVGPKGTGLAPGALCLDRVYDGPPLDPGKYSVRYRCTDDLGNVSPWAEDHTLEITG